MASPADAFKSRAMERLFAFWPRKPGVIPGASCSPMPRIWSPPPGASTLMTSAPMRASW